MASPPSSRATPLVALLTAVVLLVAACGDDSGGSASTETTEASGATTTTVAAGEGPSQTPAASLRANLEGLLTEQVFLVGNAVERAIAAGGELDGPAAAAPIAAAADSSSDLADVVGTAYGLGAGADFLDLWQAYQQALLAYGVGQGSARAVEGARQAVLDDFAALDPDLDIAALTRALEATDERLLAALDDLAAGTPQADEALRHAADEMPEAAVALASAFAAQSALEGDVTSDEAQLRADLTGLLVEHAYLVGSGVAEIVAAEGDLAAPTVQGAFDAVDANSAELADTVEDDPNAAQDFLDLWAEHVTFFQDYTVARFTGDATGIDQAESDLAGWRDDVGTLLSEKYEGLSSEAIAEELVPHVDSMLAYADASAAADRSSAELLREAAQAMPDVARTLAGAITTPT